MKFVLALGALGLSSPGFAAIDYQCWDGSFAYQYARAVETSRGVELSISGQILQLPPLFDSWLHSIHNGGFSGASASVHVALPNKPTIVNGKILLGDHARKPEGAKEDEFLQPIYPKLYLRHSQNTLDGYQWQITPIELVDVKVELSDEGISLKFDQRFDSADDIQDLGFRCASKFAPEDVVLPGEVAKHLDARN